MIDVVIVGGGPAGLLAATRLAAGLDAVVFEEHPRIGEPTHCTGIVSLETAELAKIPNDLVLARLERLGADLRAGRWLRRLVPVDEALARRSRG